MCVTCQHDYFIGEVPEYRVSNNHVRVRAGAIRIIVPLDVFRAATAAQQLVLHESDRERRGQVVHLRQPGH